MTANRKSGSPPGLRALLGRLLYGLLPHRLLQLLGAVWAYLMGPLLVPGWWNHRSARQLTGLPTGAWEELEECLEELDPWKDIGPGASWKNITPGHGVSWKDMITPGEDLGLLKTWKGVCTDPSSSWVHSELPVMWGPGLISWNDVTEGHTFSSDKTLHSVPCMLSPEKMETMQSSPLGIISYVFNLGTGGVLSRVEWENDQIMDLIEDDPSKSEFETQQMCYRKCRSVQLNTTVEAVPSDVRPNDCELLQSQTAVPELHDICLFSPDSHPASGNVSLSQGPESQSMVIADPFRSVKLTSGVDSKSPEILQNSDMDQGYHSLEYWQCSPFLQSLPTADIKSDTAKPCEEHGESVLFALPTAVSACSELVKPQNDDTSENEGLQDEIPISPVTLCTNKHIGYILGTVLTDDEEEEEEDTSHLSSDEWDKEDDDGFDSDGSLSTTSSETDVPVNVLWSSFCTTDPYNLQNFTANLQTGVIAGGNIPSLETIHPPHSDEESWCDSNAESDSESDCCADEEENHKLWNAFLKSDDPYNPLHFKAPVQTSDKKTKCCEITSTYSDMVCRHVQDHKVTLFSCQAYDLQQLHSKDTHNTPLEDSGKLRHKKVKFHEKITIYYVCNEEERKGHWEEFARDRCRFHRRIKETEFIIGRCLTPEHRLRAWERMQGHWTASPYQTPR